jgi:hypothetical protein
VSDSPETTETVAAEPEAAGTARAEPEAQEPEAQEPEAAEEPEVAAEEVEEPEIVAAVADADVVPFRVARVYICERGHRTTVMWSTPSVCHARPLRSGPECGRPLYHITELPDQVQKALNPLKASKKASKKR